MLKFPTVAHPEWLKDAIVSVQRSLRLIDEGKVPQVLIGRFLETDAKRLLRCVYGTNLEAAAALHADAIAEEKHDLEIALCPVCKGMASINIDARVEDDEGEPCPRCFPELQGMRQAEGK